MKITTIGLLFVVALVGCYEQPVEQFTRQAPTQRVRAMTKLALGSKLNEISLDTVRFNGTTYFVWAIDSMSVSYDAQQRLIRYQLQQTTQYNGKLFTSQAPDQTYLYQNGYLHEAATRYRLDSTQRRVLSYTRRGYSYTEFDSLRRYSNEGLLVSVLQTTLTGTPSFQPTGLPTVLMTIEGGNITKLGEYDYSTKALNRVTRYTYDNKRFGPLAVFTFRGESSRNALLRKTIISYDANSPRSTEYTYTNQYDKQGRLIAQLEYEEPKNSPYPGSYTLTKYYY